MYLCHAWSNGLDLRMRRRIDRHRHHIVIMLNRVDGCQVVKIEACQRRKSITLPDREDHEELVASWLWSLTPGNDNLVLLPKTERVSKLFTWCGSFDLCMSKRTPRSCHRCCRHCTEHHVDVLRVSWLDLLCIDKHLHFPIEFPWTGCT